MASAPAAAPLQLDARAWEHCVFSLHRELWRIASWEDCQDAVQDALVEALARPGLSVENVGGWLLVIARRRVLDGHKAKFGRAKDSRQRRVFVSAEAEELAEQRISTSELVELLENGAANDATVALAQLGDEQRQLVTLWLEGEPYGVVGEILGISAKAAKERTQRAFGALRQTFIASERDETCARVRRLLARRRSRGTAGAQERHLIVAHLESCGPCLAYEKRMKGVIATTPGPTLPFWQQLVLRLEQLLAGAPGPGPGSIESVAARAISTGSTGGLAPMLAVL